MIINFYVDDVMKELLAVLGLECPEYRKEDDPVIIRWAFLGVGVPWGFLLGSECLEYWKFCSSSGV